MKELLCRQATTKQHSKVTPKMIAVTGILAALYVVATLAIAPLSFGPIQLRFSELLVLLVFLDVAYAPGLIIGCMIANFFSPLGMVDVVFGTVCTAAALYGISKSKTLFVATLWPTICNAFIGVELHLYSNFPLISSMVTVALGEFAVVTCLGYPIFKKIMSNEKFVELLKIRN